MAFGECLAVDDSWHDIGNGGQPCRGQPDQSIITAFHFAPAYLFGTGVADHAVGFDARAAPHSRPVACRAYSGDRIDDPRHCCRQ